MKHVALSLLAAACGTLTAFALDATNAQIWLSDKIQPEFASIEGSGISSKEYKAEETFNRTWQYISIPLHVEGKARGGDIPHYISELKVRIIIAMKTADEKGNATDNPEVLSKEITYVDVPLSKKGDAVINVGAFVSPSNAYKLSGKDGKLEKKIIAVAVEGSFEGSNCNGAPGEKSEYSKMKMETQVVLNAKAGKELKPNWWKKKAGKSGAVLHAISETPFAPRYASMGFPASKPMYGSASAGSYAPAATVSGAVSEEGGVTTSGGPVGGPVSGPVGADTTTSGASSADTDAGDEGELEEDDASRKGKKGKKKNRARR